MPTEFRPELILAALERHGVRYVLIGGLAAAIHGSTLVTTDIDITPERGIRNLERLSAALEELGARIRAEGVPGGIPFDHSAESLGHLQTLNLATDAGDLDISFEPAGTRGFGDLSRDAVHLLIDGVGIDVASLADVIRSKEAAGRPKDLLVLPALRRILEERPASGT